MKYLITTIALAVSSQSFAASHTCKVTQMKNTATRVAELAVTKIDYPAVDAGKVSRFQIRPAPNVYVGCSYDNRSQVLQLGCEITADSRIISRNLVPASAKNVFQYSLVDTDYGIEVVCTSK